MKSNVALIGFMGTGKTVVGKTLAKKLGWQLVELDTVIEQIAGKSIPDIFGDDGEIAFRELEINAVKKVSQGKKQVIACGGGVVLNTINTDRLKQTSVVINLTASLNTILQRTVATKETRPMINVDNPEARIKELMKFRKPLYEKGADFSIDTSQREINSIVEQIIERLKSYESFDFQK
jgi:shikimate kinase